MPAARGRPVSFCCLKAGPGLEVRRMSQSVRRGNLIDEFGHEEREVREKVVTEKDVSQSYETRILAEGKKEN